MPKLTDFTSKALREFLGTRRIDAVAMVNVKAGGSAAKIDGSAGHTVMIGGVIKTACAAFNEAVLTAIAAEQLKETFQETFYTQPDGKTVYYTLLSDGSTPSATVAQVLQGTYSGQTFLNSGSKGDGSIPMPKAADTYAVIGYFKVVTNGGTFVPGTTAFDGTGVTTTFYDNILPSL